MTDETITLHDGTVLRWGLFNNTRETWNLIVAEARARIAAEERADKLESVKAEDDELIGSLRSRVEETEYRLERSNMDVGVFEARFEGWEELRVSAKALQEHHDAAITRQSQQIQAIYDAWRKALGVAEKLDIDAAVAKHDAAIRSEYEEKHEEEESHHRP